jgi:hypothetical protein
MDDIQKKLEDLAQLNKQAEEVGPKGYVDTPDAARAEAELIVNRVTAWKKYRVGWKPTRKEMDTYDHYMRWGPFSYYTWRWIAAIVTIVIFAWLISRFAHFFDSFQHLVKYLKIQCL